MKAVPAIKHRLERYVEKKLLAALDCQQSGFSLEETGLGVHSHVFYLHVEGRTPLVLKAIEKRDRFETLMRCSAHLSQNGISVPKILYSAKDSRLFGGRGLHVIVEERILGETLKEKKDPGGLIAPVARVFSRMHSIERGSWGKIDEGKTEGLYAYLLRKTHDKIYVVKPMVEIGQKLGYLPGNIEEKMEPYTRYITDLILKLHKLRPANRIFVSPDDHPQKYNSKRFELLPLTYIRGMNIENSIVIIDEMQNMSRAECRTLLSRMGEGVKCICLGDIHQVDHPYLNSENNGLNWVVNKFRGSKIYAHMVLKGDKSRGPITDLVIKSGL